VAVDDQDDDDGPAFTSHVAAFDHAVLTAPHLPRDLAAVHLARHYASMLDDAFDRLTDSAEQDDEDSRSFARVVGIVAKIGPRYEAVLDKLGMSPGARPAVRGGEPHGVDPAATALERLRGGGAAAGVDPAAYLDPAVAEALADD
jgi:hypothetical protein